MFKNILLPVDGSELSMKAANEGIQLAKSIGASVVALFGRLPPDAIYSVEYVPMDPEMMRRHDAHQMQVAEHVFSGLRATAQAGGVPFTSVSETNKDVAGMITAVAQKNKCDLIVIGSHGRGALGRMFLGGVAVKLLSHSKIPVLIYRETPEAA